MFGPDYKALHIGEQLQALEVDNLEKNEKSKSYKNRLRLVGFYNDKIKQQLSRRSSHLIWLIKQHPALKVWRHVRSIYLPHDFAPRSFSKLKQLWLAQVDKCEGDFDVIGNAGLFIIENEFVLGKEMLLKAALLNPGEYFWPDEIAEHCFFQAQYLSEGDPTRRDLAKEIISHGDLALDLYGTEGFNGTNGSREIMVMRGLIAASWLHDKSLAQRYMVLHEEVTKGWTAFHRRKSAESIWGIMEVEDGSVQAGINILLKLDESKTPDEWDLKLAKELFRRGHQKQVREYINKSQALGYWTERSTQGWFEYFSEL